MIYENMNGQLPRSETSTIAPLWKDNTQNETLSSLWPSGDVQCNSCCYNINVRTTVDNNSFYSVSISENFNSSCFSSPFQRLFVLGKIIIMFRSYLFSSVSVFAFNLRSLFYSSESISHAFDCLAESSAMVRDDQYERY